MLSGIAGFASPAAPFRKLKRGYVRKPTCNAPGIRAPTSPPQIADLAFNIHGWALEDGMINRAAFEVINAYKATMIKGGFEAKIRELQGTGIGGVYRQDHIYTRRELDVNLANDDPSVAQYLVIGYTLQEDDPLYQENKTFVRYSENELVGETRAAPEHTIGWDEVYPPLLVVTPIKENIGTSIRLFGLIMPRSGLCQPVLLTHERIFYRWEFRASAGARPAQRNKNWNQVIIDKAKELTPPEQLLANKQEDSDLDTPIKRRRMSGPRIKQEEDEDLSYAEMAGQLPDPDVFEMILDLDTLLEGLTAKREPISLEEDAANVLTRLKIILNDEGRGILTAVRTSQSSRLSQQVRDSFMKVSDNKMPTRQSRAIAHFAKAGTTLNHEEARYVVAEIVEIWRRHNSIVDVDSIMRLKQAMNDSNVSVSFEIMKDFLNATVGYMKVNTGCSDHDLRHKVHEAVQMATALSQGSLSRGDTQSIGMDAVYLVTLLKEMVDIHNWQDLSTKHMFNGQAPETFNGMEIEHYLNVKPIEQAASEMPYNIKYLVNIARNRGCGVDDILLWLERLRLRIRQI